MLVLRGRLAVSALILNAPEVDVFFTYAYDRVFQRKHQETHSVAPSYNSKLRKLTSTFGLAGGAISRVLCHRHPLKNRCSPEELERVATTLGTDLGT